MVFTCCCQVQSTYCINHTGRDSLDKLAGTESKKLLTENCILLIHYAASSGNFLMMFSGQPIGSTFRGQESKRS